MHDRDLTRLLQSYAHRGAPARVPDPAVIHRRLARRRRARAAGGAVLAAVMTLVLVFAARAILPGVEPSAVTAPSTVATTGPRR